MILNNVFEGANSNKTVSSVVNDGFVIFAVAILGILGAQSAAAPIVAGLMAIACLDQYSLYKGGTNG